MLRLHKIYCALILVVLNILLSSVQAAPVYIDITGGQNTGIPIVVLPFEVTRAKDPIDRAVEVQDLAEVIRSDLHYSGHFRALDVQNIDKTIREAKDIDPGYWKNFGAANIVIGQVTGKGNGLYDVSFQLFDIYKNSTQPILSVRYPNKYQDQFRVLAHRISDEIFKKITGVRGFFSTKIAYIEVNRAQTPNIHNLIIADADGYDPKTILKAPYPIMSPRWSPDAKQLAFVSFKGKTASINVITLATGEIQTLTQFPGINCSPIWSPDGSKMAMVLSKDGAPKIYLMDLGSKQVTRLTSGGSIDTEPYWSADGNSIYFTSNRGGKPQIYKLILQSGAIERVTFNGDYNATPSITPDGKQLIMLHQNENGAYNVAVQDLSSGKVKMITSASLDDSPTLAPNGMMVLYGTREADQTVLGAVTLDGKFRMRMPVQNGNVKEPAWSPFLFEE